MRLDLYLSSTQNITRTKAKQLIEGGFVKINGKYADKPAIDVKENDLIETVGSFKFSSLGGDKLEKAINDFDYSVKDKVCVDIGASNGGFTDCLLQRGAKKVYAVDVGECAFDDRLKNDSRVVVKDRVNARYITREDLGEPCDFACVDVSFISLKLILPAVARLIKDNGGIIALIKPQFEAGSKNLTKKGIVLSEKVRSAVCRDIIEFSNSIGLKYVNITEAPLRLNKNKEFLIYLCKSVE